MGHLFKNAFMHATHNGRGSVFVLRISSCNNVRNPLPLLSLLQPPTYLPLRLLVDPTTYHAVRRVVMHLISCQPYLLRGGVAIKKNVLVLILSHVQTT